MSLDTHRLLCRECGVTTQTPRLLRSEWKYINPCGVRIGPALKEHEAVCPVCAGEHSEDNDTQDNDDDNDGENVSIDDINTHRYGSPI